jgi:hypothetical protein
MSWGDNSKFQPITEAYRNNKFWDGVRGESKETQQQLSELEECKRQRDIFKQLLEAAMESLPDDSITYVAISEALGDI